MVKSEIKEFEGYCYYCGRYVDKAQVTLLSPDEKWICKSCLKRKMAQVPIGL